MKHNLQAGLCLLALALSPAALAASDPLRNTLEESKSSGKGLTFYIKGQAIGGVVTRIDDQFVEARSQAHGTIILRLDRIEAWPAIWPSRVPRPPDAIQSRLAAFPEAALIQGSKRLPNATSAS